MCSTRKAKYVMVGTKNQIAEHFIFVNNYLFMNTCTNLNCSNEKFSNEVGFFK